jgi:hypothetical protein
MSVVDELTNLANLIEDKTRSIIASGQLQAMDEVALRPVAQVLTRIAAPVQELKGTISAAFSNKTFQEMVDTFLSVDRKLSGIADDDEAAAIGRFRKSIVVLVDTMDRIEVRSGVVDMFRVVIVRAGNALIRWLQVSNEFVGEVRKESVSINTDVDRKFVALGVTFWLDRDDGWTKVGGEPDAELRAAIGAAADGVSDDSMVQMVYGALSGQLEEEAAIDESVLIDAREFILGTFTEAGADDDDDDQDQGDDEEDGGDDDDNDEEQPSKRSKTNDDDDEAEDHDADDEE